MTDEVVGETKPKKTKAKSITREELDQMFKRRDEELSKKIDEMCDTCSHHECACPEKIEALDKHTDERMDRLDENDELLRQGINDLAEQSSKDVRALELKLEEERRLRAKTDEMFVEVRDQALELHNKLAVQDAEIENYRKVVQRNSDDVLKLGILAAIAGAVALVLTALAVTGNL